jgi:hypothetical protein
MMKVLSFLLLLFVVVEAQKAGHRTTKRGAKQAATTRKLKGSDVKGASKAAKGSKSTPEPTTFDSPPPTIIDTTVCVEDAAICATTTDCCDELFCYNGNNRKKCTSCNRATKSKDVDACIASGHCVPYNRRCFSNSDCCDGLTCSGGKCECAKSAKGSKKVSSGGEC